MVKVRNDYEIKLMRKGGNIAALALKNALQSVKVGIKGTDIDEIAEKVIYERGGDLSYKTVPGYNFATCITINEQVVHGIPSDRPLQDGDLISIDLAVLYKGWHTDTAWTVLVKDPRPCSTKRGGQRSICHLVGKDQKEKNKFLKTGEDALWLGIAQAVDGNKIGDISSAIQQRIEGAGYSVVRSLVGHGVGKSLHEDPEVPGYGVSGTGMVLKPGMTLAIEVIYTMGLPEVVVGPDGWTFLTADKSLSGLFEMTVLVGKQEPEVLTDFRKF